MRVCPRTSTKCVGGREGEKGVCREPLLPFPSQLDLLSRSIPHAFRFVLSLLIVYYVLGSRLSNGDKKKKKEE